MNQRMGDFFEQLQRLWPLVMSAPWGFAPLFALLLFAGWVTGRFAFGERIANLKSRLESRDEKISTLEARLLEQQKKPVKQEPVLPRPTLGSQIPSLGPAQIAKPSAPATASASAEKSGSLSDTLIRQRWVFHFSPSGNNGRKKITFLPDGTIGDGRNENEFRWVFEGELLAIYRHNGDVQNVFRYNVGSGRFEYVPDSRSRGFKDQFIQPQ